VNELDGLFLMDFLGRNLRTLMHHVHGHCHGGTSTFQVKVQVFSSELIPVTFSTHTNKAQSLICVH
jgi:hypothetical protein